MQDWTLNAARTTLISQNKEGLVSLPGSCPSFPETVLFSTERLTNTSLYSGYLAIYLIGMGAGLFVLPPDPSFFYRSRSIRRSDSVDEQEFKEKKIEKAWKEKPGKLMSVLGSLSVLWCSGYGISRWLGWEVSRRLVRLSLISLSFALFSSNTDYFILCAGESSLRSVDRLLQHILPVCLSDPAYLGSISLAEWEITCADDFRSDQSEWTCGISSSTLSSGFDHREEL